MNKQPVSVRSLFGFPIVRGIGRDYTIPQVDLSAEPDGIQPLITVDAVVHTSAIRIPFSPNRGNPHLLPRRAWARRGAWPHKRR